MKMGFTGTRKGMTPDQKRVFRFLVVMFEPDEFHHGDCIGADFEAAGIVHEIQEDWLDNLVTIVSHPPINETRRAWAESDLVLVAKEYFARNRDIVNDTGILVATPAGFAEELHSGTWFTIRYALRKSVSKPIIIIWPDGSALIDNLSGLSGTLE